MGVEFFIDVEDGAGQRLGGGPITSASGWRYTAKIDRAGDFAFAMPANDPKAALIQKKRVVRAYAMLNGVKTAVGSGIVDSIERQPVNDGTVTLRVSGSDLLRELTYRSVLNLRLYDNGLPVSHSTALTAVAAFAPAGWTVTPDGAPPNNLVYGHFNGGTVLDALIKTGEKSQSHFTGGLNRTVTFASNFTPSGLRAIQAGRDLAPETCAITSLTEIVNTFDLITRIYPRGSGNADVQLTLRATSRTAPSGYTLNATQNYIENTAAASTYGRIERQIDYREIGPISNSDADIQSAANALFDASLETLKRHSAEMELATYQISVAGCSALLRPMQSIRVVYRDIAAGLNVNADLNILEATWSVDADGVKTTGLVVSHSDRMPTGDTGTLADSMEQGQVYQALPQLNANSYVMSYTKPLDLGNSAAFRFRFGAEVVQLQQVLFEYQVLPLESTVNAVGGVTSGSGDIPTTGPSTNDTGTGGNNDTGSGGGGDTSSATPSLGSATPAIGSAGGGDTGSAAPSINPTSIVTNSASLAVLSADVSVQGQSLTTNSATPGIGSTTVTLGSTGLTTAFSSEATTSATDGVTGDSPELETDGPEGGDVVGSGRHEHEVPVYDVSPTPGAALVWASYDSFSSSWIFVAATGNNRLITTTPRGNHTHNIGDHTHSIGSHTHTVAGHTHTVTGHAHTVSPHTHTVNSHTHTIASHTHGVPSHTHSAGSHTHDISAHGHNIDSHTHGIDSHAHTIAAHTHTIAAHTHTISAHTHTMSNHTHSLNNHTHDIGESLTAIYGIFREIAGNTLANGDLQYRVNGGSWLELSTSTDAGDGWRQLDITSLVMDATTFRPLTANNMIEVRSDAVDKTATIDAQLSVRNIIQSIALV